jgi:hypothetical protein
LRQHLWDILQHLSHAKEECGIGASLNHCGTLLFVSKGGPEWAFQIELYRAETYNGTLIEFVAPHPSALAVIYLIAMAQD